MAVNQVPDLEEQDSGIGATSRLQSEEPPAPPPPATPDCLFPRRQVPPLGSSSTNLSTKEQTGWYAIAVLSCLLSSRRALRLGRAPPRDQEDLSEWGAPPAEKVIDHTNMYWANQAAPPNRTAEVVTSADLAF